MTLKPLVLCISMFCGSAWAAPANQVRTQVQTQVPNQQQQAHPRHVDVVLALDTSSSMDGLIDGARQKLWDVVTTLSKAQPQPILRVGIVSYGNTAYDASKGWVRPDIDLTTDLDSVYGKLFGLTTNGGEEYVARAVQTSTDQMSWSKQQDTLRILFVAGNESAEQDPSVKLETALADARSHGIFVNTIYCGAKSSPETVAWARTAALGKGKFAAIDQNRTVAIATPQDAELQRLSAQLNDTYVAYGAGGRARAANQKAQDKNATALSQPAAAARAVGKASSLYRSADWDIVDAKREGITVAAAEMPEDLRAMPAPQRDAVIEKKAKDRAALQSRIQAVSKQREGYLSAERKKSVASGPALDDALIGGLKSEAEQSGFKF
ncbi:MAG: vWA domain-containing protein [Polyangia bacterium]